jgi:hypothetical protein
MLELNERDEQLLLEGVKRAAELADSGLPANAAMLKAAQEMKYTPGFLRVACNAFNTGRQNAQWDSSSDILDKLASVELVNYNEVADELWGGKATEKYASYAPTVATNAPQRPPVTTYTDVRASWRLSGPQFAVPTVEKQASEKTADEKRAEEAGDLAFKFRNLNHLKQAMERTRADKFAAESAFNVELHKLYSYFRQSPDLRSSLESVKTAAVTYRGDICSALFDYVQSVVPTKLLQGGHNKVASDWSQAPLCYVDSLLKKGKELADRTTTYEKVASEYADLYNALHAGPKQPAPAPSPAAELDLGIPKNAGILGGILSAGAFGATRSTMDSLREDEDRKLEKYVTELDSPDHLNQLRNVRAQTILAELMSDPDNPISSYDPEQVAREYNNIVEMSPRLADQPSVVSSLLNKRLVGNVEPFELAETLKLEEGLKKTQAPAAERTNNAY